MAKRSIKGFLYSGTEVVTNDLRIAFVEQFNHDNTVTIRYHNPLWPFPEWDVKSRKQLTPVEAADDPAMW